MSFIEIIPVGALFSRMRTGEISRSILKREEPLAAGKKDLEITQAFLTLAPVTKTGENLSHLIKAIYDSLFREL